MSLPFGGRKKEIMTKKMYKKLLHETFNPITQFLSTAPHLLSFFACKKYKLFVYVTRLSPRVSDEIKTLPHTTTCYCCL